MSFIHLNNNIQNTRIYSIRVGLNDCLLLFRIFKAQPKEWGKTCHWLTEVLITIWIFGNPECLRSVVDRFNNDKNLFYFVFIAEFGERFPNNLSGQYMMYLLVWNWAPLGKMINFGSFAQRNALDQQSNDPSLDHAHQWSDEFFSRVDLIDHWSEYGFARKEHHRSEIQIRILPHERTLKFWASKAKFWRISVLIDFLESKSIFSQTKYSVIYFP